MPPVSVSRREAGEAAPRRALRLTPDRLYEVFHPRFVRRRMQRFLETFAPDERTTILDVGGTPLNWSLAHCAAQVTLLNPMPVGDVEAPNLSYVAGDGRDLHFADGAFEIVFSNSVIEHLGTLEDQRRFAAEVRRVGRAVWVQTPARSFPVEAHFLTPFVQFLPKGWQRRLARHLTVWGLLARPTLERVDDLIDELRLLTLDEMRSLFPDCEIRRERFLGLTKAYIAVRGARRERGGG